MMYVKTDKARAVNAGSRLHSWTRQRWGKAASEMIAVGSWSNTLKEPCANSLAMNRQICRMSFNARG